MSEKKDDIFKDIFQKEFQNHKETVEEENWDFIAARLEKKRFYKLSFSRFNIYYALLVIALFSISFIALLVWFKKQEFPTLNSSPKSNPAPENLDSDLRKKGDSISFFNNKENQKFIPQKLNISKDNKAENTSSLSNQNTGSRKADSTRFSTSEPKTTGLSSQSVNGIMINDNDPSAIKKRDTISVAPKESKKNMVRKTIYLIKQDTLISVDTIRGESNKRKNKK